MPAALAHLKRDTGATMMAMKGDVWALENGKHFGDQNYVGTFAPVKVDRVLSDGAKVTLGGVTMTALATPGHTSGLHDLGAAGADRRPGVKTVVFPVQHDGRGQQAGRQPAISRASSPIIAGRSIGWRSSRRISCCPRIPSMADVTTRKGDEFLQPTLLPKLVADARAAFEKQWLKESAIAPLIRKRQHRFAPLCAAAIHSSMEPRRRTGL